MVTSIARQSVIIKCNMQKSVLTGNYEFYYAAGLLAKLTGVAIDDAIPPGELMELCAERARAAEPKDERERHLFLMLADYRPDETCDAQMRELLVMGRDERHLWEVTVPS
ncbi:MAG: DUF3837 domain-containing protein [Roseburia sp.]